ncbi:hypothetical protein Tco_1423888, partial [Tanacetum coccineum]
MAAPTRFYFFLCVVLLSITISESRILLSNEINERGLIEKANEIIEESTRRHNMEQL